jgi:AAHS family 4-hydroxybenzoate transporter-like MFS transporter
VNLQPTCDIAECIDRCPVGRLQIAVVGLCCLVALLDGFDAQSIGLAAAPIASSLAIRLDTFGAVFSAGLAGLMLGAFAFGRLGDRWGRKPILIIATLTFGALALATAAARTREELIAARFLTGIGLGGAMPNVVALATDYMPARLQRIPACLISAAMPAGGMLAGLIAVLVLHHVGWRGLFYVGGGAPLFLALLLIIALPESIRYLCLRRAEDPRIGTLMRRILPAAEALPKRFTATQETRQLPAVTALFRERRALTTLSLSVACFMNLLVIYSVVSWMPPLLADGSPTASVGILAVTSFSLGAIPGSVLQGPLLTRFRPTPVFVTELVTFILLILLLASRMRSETSVLTIAFLLGWTIQGAQAGVNALSASSYPAGLRSTALGWVLGIGRLGSIIGPMLGGVALQSGWTPQQILTTAAVPAGLAALTLMVANARRQAPAVPKLSTHPRRP